MLNSSLLRLISSLYSIFALFHGAVGDPSHYRCHPQQVEENYNVKPSLRDCIALANDMRNGPKSYSLQKYSSDPKVGNIHLPHLFTLGGDCLFQIDQTKRSKELGTTGIFSQYDIGIVGYELTQTCFVRPQMVIASTFLDDGNTFFLMVYGLKKPRHNAALTDSVGNATYPITIGNPTDAAAMLSPPLPVESSAAASAAATPSTAPNTTVSIPNQDPPSLATRFVPGPAPSHLHCYSTSSPHFSPADLVRVTYPLCAMAINSMLLEPSWDRNRVYSKHSPFLLPKYWRPRASPCFIRLYTDIGTPDNVRDIFSLEEVFRHVWWLLEGCHERLGGRSRLGRQKGFEILVMGVDPATSVGGVELLTGNGTGSGDE